jgi:hypothetical protein
MVLLMNIFQIDVVFSQTGLVATIINFLKSKTLRVLTGALRTVGNIITGTDLQTTHILELDVLHHLVGQFLNL